MSPEQLGRITLGYRSVDVVRVPHDQLENRAGLYRAMAGDILVATGLREAEEVHTILHELLHLVWVARGVERGDDEERIVSALAEGLVELFARNAYAREIVTRAGNL